MNIKKHGNRQNEFRACNSKDIIFLYGITEQSTHNACAYDFTYRNGEKNEEIGIRASVHLDKNDRNDKCVGDDRGERSKANQLVRQFAQIIRADRTDKRCQRAEHDVP